MEESFDPQAHLKEISQGLFNRVAEHLLKQNQRSLLPSGKCAYYGVGGLRCALGCLVTEGSYSPSIEGNGIGTPAVDKALQQSGVPFYSPVVALLEDLQGIHDIWQPDTWPLKLGEIATKYGLSAVAVDAFRCQP